ncbi:MAG: hypothetical protein HQK60_19475 [Deltaproteobacteria bacterium]|nr:hypothetical protein [Deltaproteobacteria bacterium]
MSENNYPESATRPLIAETTDMPPSNNLPTSERPKSKTINDVIQEEGERFEKAGGLLNLIFELRGRLIIKSHYLSKLKLACNTEMSNLKQQVELRLKSGQKISKADYEDIILKARTLRDNTINALTSRAQREFDQALKQATKDYEEALLSCDPPDHENELINEARRRLVMSHTKTYLTNYQSIMGRMENFFSHWGNTVEGTEILTLE